MYLYFICFFVHNVTDHIVVEYGGDCEDEEHACAMYMQFHVHYTSINCCSTTKKIKSSHDAQNNINLGIQLMHIVSSLLTNTQQPKIMLHESQYIKNSSTDSSNSKIYKLRIMTSSIRNIAVWPWLFMTISHSNPVADYNWYHCWHCAYEREEISGKYACKHFIFVCILMYGVVVDEGMLGCLCRVGFWLDYYVNIWDIFIVKFVLLILLILYRSWTIKRWLLKYLLF